MTDKHPIHEELKGDFRQAFRAKSKKECLRLRQQGLTKMAKAPKNLFWSGVEPLYRHDPLYIEACSKAWEYITKKIYGKLKRGEIYDPDTGNASPITLWNKRCKGEYFDLCEKKQTEQKWIERNPIDSRTGDPLNIDDLADPDAKTPLLKLQEQEKIDPIAKIREIIQQDAEEIYSKTFVRKKPPPAITARAVLLEIVDTTSRGEKWTYDNLAQHFNMPAGTIRSAMKRKLSPMLIKIGESLRNEI